MNIKDPVKAIRKFCGDGELGDTCTDIRDYLLKSIDETDSGLLDAVLPRYEDDTIVFMHTDGAPYLSTVLKWGHIELSIDLSHLGSTYTCVTLELPPFTNQVDSEISQLCLENNVKGMYCTELTSEVHNYLNSLYTSGYVNLRDLLLGMHFQDYFRQLYFSVDIFVVHSEEPRTIRHFFVPEYATLFASGIELCLQYSFSRSACSGFMEYYQEKINAYYPHTIWDLWSFLYVSRALNAILQEKHHINAQEEVTEYVDADFIEIGTSNFNTITQLVDDADHLVGFAVEPSAHYLRSLPDRQGVTKVNCAIVPSSSAPTGSVEKREDFEKDQQVGFYYIPEHVIREKDLGHFLMGCNSIGGYHPMHTSLGYEMYVQIEKVYAYTIEQFLRMHRIRKIRLLKIDAEGYDVIIMEELYLYLVAKDDKILYPQRIVFESNSLSPKVDGLIVRFVALGYTLVMSNDDTILEI